MNLCYSRLSCVEELDFCDKELTESDAKFLAGFLPHFTRLKSLSLFGIWVGRSGVLALAASLEKCPKLHTFDLVQGKYKFLVEHADIAKGMSQQGYDLSWWGTTKKDVEKLLPPEVKVLFGC